MGANQRWAGAKKTPSLIKKNEKKRIKVPVHLTSEGLVRDVGYLLPPEVLYTLGGGTLLGRRRGQIQGAVLGLLALTAASCTEQLVVDCSGCCVFIF